MSEAPLHPRDVYQMDGAQEAEQALLDSDIRPRLVRAKKVASACARAAHAHRVAH